MKALVSKQQEDSWQKTGVQQQRNKTENKQNPTQQI